MASADDLWGSRLLSVTFDPVTHRCTLDAMADDASGTTAYRVDCQSVVNLSFRSTIPEPWTYADVTEVYVTEDGSTGQHVVEIMLWSEGAGIDIRCGTVEITEV